MYNTHTNENYITVLKEKKYWFFLKKIVLQPSVSILIGFICIIFIFVCENNNYKLLQFTNIVPSCHKNKYHKLPSRNYINLIFLFWLSLYI